MIVKEKIRLIDYLNSIYNKKETKKILKEKEVYVNSKAVSKFDYMLNINDEVKIIKKIDEIPILYEDDYIIIVSKPSLMLTVSDMKRSINLYNKVGTYLKSKNKNAKVFIVHRLDFETSGIVVFAKDEKTKMLLQKNWDKTKRYYKAIVHGITKEKEILNFKLKEDKNLFVHVHNSGIETVTIYEKIKNNNNYSLLNIEIKTGKKHQIRVSLEEINHPILGDKKYGIKDNFKKMYLLADKIEFTHPITNKEIKIELELPNDFKKLV